jgi:transcriptional regulator with XRE-family HTH domain
MECPAALGQTVSAGAIDDLSRRPAVATEPGGLMDAFDSASAQPALPLAITQDQLAMAGRVESTVLRIAVGMQLRKRREAAGVSREEAAYLIRSSGAKISRMELGRHRFKERDLIDLLVLYGADEADRAQFLDLARQANAPGWWQRYEDLLPPWFETYVAMEQAASVIRTYEMHFVPGLLQTNEYTRAVTRLAYSNPEEVERRVDLRRRRREILTSSNAPQVWAVIDEAALHRPPGGSALCRAQMEHLLELNELSNISVQIATFSRGVHPATGGPFTILRFPVQDLPDVVYLEHLNGALYLDKASDVEDYVDLWHRLCTHIDPPERSRSTLERIRAQVCGYT